MIFLGCIWCVNIGVMIVDVGGAGRGRQQVRHDGPYRGVPRVVLTPQVQGNPIPSPSDKIEAKG